MVLAPADSRVSDGKVRIPRAERVVFPLNGFTKAQVVDYYIRVAPYLLPHLRDRCLSLKRYPDGSAGDFFWEKDAPAFTPKWVQTHAVPRRSGESDIHYIVVNNLRTLAWAAGVSTLEFHPFLSRIDDFERPTAVVFDLDPGEPAGILESAKVAFALRDLMARLNLQCFAEVSGSKGIQVYVPLNTPATYGDTQAFAKAVAAYLESRNPKQVISEMERSQRRGKVFVDWSQNADYKTTVAVYSLRAKRRHPYISLPVTWDQLQEAVQANDDDSLYFAPEVALRTLQSTGDLFAPVLTLHQSLPASFDLGSKSAIAARQSATHEKSRSLLHMPSASSQGGRRLFSISKNAPGKGVQLRMQLWHTLKTWHLPHGLPKGVGQTFEAQLAPSTATMNDDVRTNTPGEQIGTCELIEGSVKAGYLDLYLSSPKYTGEWLLASSQSKGGADWHIRKPDAAESGLSFELPRRDESARSRGKDVAIAPRIQKSSERNRRRESTSRISAPENEVANLSKDNAGLKRLPKKVPAFMVPMECRMVAEVPNGSEWLYELKLDGYRAVAVKQKSVSLLSRYGRSFRERFPHIVTALERMQLPDCVLDGEVVALDEEGRPNFQELQNSRSTQQPIVYYVFDILNCERRWLQTLSLAKRREILEQVAKSFIDPVRLSVALHAKAGEFLEQVRRLGLEGVVAKRLDSIYEPGKRPGSWVKYRVNEREEFIIGGYRRSEPQMDAILVGQFRDGKLWFVEKVKNGFVPETRKQVFEALQDLVTTECPFANLPERDNRRGAVNVEQMKRCVWVEPVQRCEVDFVEWTVGGHLRHAAFRELTGRNGHARSLDHKSAYKRTVRR